MILIAISRAISIPGCLCRVLGHKPEPRGGLLQCIATHVTTSGRVVDSRLHYLHLRKIPQTISAAIIWLA
jgi:hypothetical protein